MQRNTSRKNHPQVYYINFMAMIKSNTLKYFLLLTQLMIICLASHAQHEKAEADMQAIMTRFDIVGLSVAVVKNSHIIYAHSFGLKKIESNTPLNNTDIFRIASISKSFSATSIMQLIQAKNFSLDDDFGDLIGFKVRNPKFPETVITLKMAMSHTSSINDSQGYFNLDVINPKKNPEWARCYNSYEPGKDYQYCNLNYNMIGTIIEKFSGERFDGYVKHHILDPLGLYGGYNVDSLDSSLLVPLYEKDSTTNKYKAASMAYAPRREEIRNYVMGQTTAIFSPTGGMKISATDLAKYMTMHMNKGKYKEKRIISKKSSTLMQTKVAEEESYGLAIHSIDDLLPGEVLKGHTGSAYGLHSAMFFHPKKKYGFVVITNGCIPTYTRGLNDVLRASMVSLYEHFIK